MRRNRTWQVYNYMLFMLLIVRLELLFDRFCIKRHFLYNLMLLTLFLNEMKNTNFKYLSNWCQIGVKP